MKRPKQYRSLLGGLALALALTVGSRVAHANVYATNIKINGHLTGATGVGQNGGATISYILNDNASGGVAIQIFSGATPVRTILIAGGAGTTQGLNSVAWDGKDDSNAYLALGNYTVQVTAASTGYAGPNWTQIVSYPVGQKIYYPHGIAVNNNTNSPYYGRVFVGNGVNSANNVAPHTVGVYKFNADASEADEGQSLGGNPYRLDNFLGDSVRGVHFNAGDDRVYYLDWVGNGKVNAFDSLITTNQTIVNADNNAQGLAGLASGMADFDVTDGGTTNAIVWLADADFPSVGVWAFPMTNNGVADSAVGGINVVSTGGSCDIPLRSGFGMMIGSNANLFIGEVRANTGDPTPRCINITNIWQDGSGNPTNWWNNAGQTYPICSGDLNWAVGGADDTFRNVADVAIDSRTNPKFVACAMNGASAGCRVLNAADGTLAVNINQNASVFYIGTGWDGVGNVYLGNANQSWQVFSPPGANQSTTPAIASVQVVVVPHITKISDNGTTVTINFTGGATDPSSAFTLISSVTPAPIGSYTTAAGQSITGSGGSYIATVPTSGAVQFYRIKR